MLRQSATRDKPRERKAKLLMFRYTARAEQGRVVKGSVKAISEVAAQNLLVAQGFTPLSLDPIASPFSLEGAIPSMFGIKLIQVITFSRQLATLLESGVSLLPALQLLEGLAIGSQAFGRVVRSIAQDLGTGRSFAAAIGRHPSAFNEIYTRTIAIGERTGKLESVLREMAILLQRHLSIAPFLELARQRDLLVCGEQRDTRHLFEVEADGIVARDFAHLRGRGRRTW